MILFRELKQLSFLPSLKISTSLAHGGDTRKGKRKVTRPFDPKRALHVVLCSSRATKHWSMLIPKHRDAIDRALDRLADQYRIKIHRFANVGNHLHMLITVRTRRELQAFLRRFSGEVALRVTGACKSKAVGRFWDKLAFSRVVSWGQEFQTVMRYLVKNLFEAAGLWNRKKFPDAVILEMPRGSG